MNEEDVNNKGVPSQEETSIPNTEEKVAVEEKEEKQPLSDKETLEANFDPKVEYYKKTKEKGDVVFYSETDIARYAEAMDSEISKEELSALRDYELQVKKARQRGKSDKDIAAIPVPISKERLEKHFKTSKGSTLLLDDDSGFRDALTECGPTDVRVPDDEGGYIYQNTPNTKSVGTITNASELLAALATTGFKTNRELPLFSSAIRMHVHTPSNTALSECINEIYERKTQYGDMTAGYYLSTDMVHISTKLARLVLNNTHHTNIVELKEMDSVSRVTELAKLIPVTEIGHLLQGCGSTLHPKGYPLTVACTNPKCGVETDWSLNIDHTCNHLTSKLGKEGIRNMRKTKNSITIAQVKEHQEKFFESLESRVFSMGNIKVVFKIPSLHEYEEESLRWIEEIADAVNDFVGQEFSTEQARESAVMSRIDYESLNRYFPYIKKIIISSRNSDSGEDYESIIESSPERFHEVKETLSTLSEFNDMKEGILNAVVKFIAEATTTAIGAALPKCPECHSDNEDTSEHSSSLMLFDPVRLFLELREWKLTQERSTSQ